MDVEPDVPRKRRRKWPIVLSVIAVAALLAVGCAVMCWWQMREASPFPEDIRESTDYALVYPSQNKPETEWITKAKGIVSYNVKYEDSIMYITLQKMPTKLKLSDFENRLEEPRAIRTPLGKAILGQYADHEVGSMKIDNTWLLLTAAKDTPQSDVEAVLQQLKKS